MKKAILRLLSPPFKKRYLSIQKIPPKGFEKLVSPNRVFNFFSENVDTNTTSIYEHTTLFTLAATTDGNIIELGTYIGKTAIIMASAIPEQSDRKVYTVDIFSRKAGDKSSRESHLFKDVDQYELCNTLISKNNLTDKIVVLKGTTNDCIDRLKEIPNVQIIFIDADHSYEAVKQDIHNYANMIVKGGYLIMHDYLLEKQGVKQAVDEYIQIYMTFDIVFLIGSMLVLKKK